MSELDDTRPTMGQLRKRVWHARNVLNRRLEELATEAPGAGEAVTTGLSSSQVAAWAARRDRVHAAKDKLEHALAELHAHPDWRGK